MGKYRIREESLGEGDIPVLLQCIANELAEGNRLKRLKLKHFTWKIVKGEYVKVDSFPEELEDKG